MLRRHFALGLLGAAAFAPQAVQAQTQPYTLVILGDSLTAGLGLPRSQSFPSRLEALLRGQGYGVRILNAGVSGDTVAAGLARLDWSVPNTANGVLVALGANDMLQGLDPVAARRDLGAILQRLQARGLDLAIAGMRAGSNWGEAYARAYDALFPELAKRYDAPLYPFLLEGVAFDPALNQADGVHPNAAGAVRIAERLAPFVARAFPLPKVAATTAATR